jgi:hypothetical protein
MECFALPMRSMRICYDTIPTPVMKASRTVANCFQRLLALPSADRSADHRRQSAEVLEIATIWCHNHLWLGT